MARGGGPEFPDVDSRFDLQPKHLFGPFWSLTVIDTFSQRSITAISGGPLTGYGSVRRQARFGTQRYLSMNADQQRRASRPV